MRIVVLLVVFGVLAWVIMSRKSADKAAPTPAPTPAATVAAPTPTPVLTPEQETEALLKGEVKAEDLVHFCQKYPQAQKLLQGHTFTITGRVKKVGIFGMQEDQGDITLASDVPLFIVIECKIDRVNANRLSNEFKLVDGDLFLESGKDKRPLAILGSPVTMKVTLKNVTPASIRVYNVIK